MTLGQRATVARYRRANPTVLRAADWIALGRRLATSLDPDLRPYERGLRLAAMLTEEAHAVVAPVKNPIRRKRLAVAMTHEIKLAWRGLVFTSESRGTAPLT